MDMNGKEAITDAISILQYSFNITIFTPTSELKSDPL